MFVLIFLLLSFIYSNFFWWRYVPYGLATSSRGLGFPWIYSRRLCGDTIPIQCGSWIEEGKLALNILIWLGLMLFVITASYLLEKRKV